MDGHSRSLCSSSSSSHHAYYQENQDQISYLLGATSSSYPPPHAVGSLQSKAEKMSLSFCDAGAGNDFGAVGPSGTDQFSLLNSTRKSPDPELDSLDCEIEDGAEVSEERAKLAPVRTSSSKRNRAAEVHNLSEKRRRSKINEKMKALQSLIPNSSKTDKASMLDEAIEYLKQLQLQVQMLSMRNSLSQHPIYMSGALQALQMGVDFGLVTDKGSSVPNSFDLSTSSHQSASIPSIINITRPATSFAMESSQSHHGSYLSPASIEDILTRELIPHQQPDARHSPRNLTGNEVNSMAATASQHSRGQAPALVGADHAEECILGRVRSHDVLSEEPEKETFLQHLPR